MKLIPQIERLAELSPLEFSLCGILRNPNIRLSEYSSSDFSLQKQKDRASVTENC